MSKRSKAKCRRVSERSERCKWTNVVSDRVARCKRHCLWLETPPKNLLTFNTGCVSSPFRGTLTGIPVYPVHTNGTMVTRLALTFVHVWKKAFTQQIWHTSDFKSQTSIWNLEILSIGNVGIWNFHVSNENYNKGFHLFHKIFQSTQEGIGR